MKDLRDLKDRLCCPDAEMGELLAAVDLGDGRTAVSVSAGAHHMCALLVRCVWEDSSWGLVCLRGILRWRFYSKRVSV